MEYTDYLFTSDDESFQPRAYQDSGGVWTIGYGHTKGVKEGDQCTRAQAEVWLHQDMQWAVNTVNDALTSHNKTVPQGTFNALSDFVFNVGSKAFLQSKFLNFILIGDTDAACADILNYDHDSHGEVLPGLVKRRRKEVSMIDPTYFDRTEGQI